MNKHNVTILVLCVCAAMLSALLIGSYATQPAQASSSSVRSANDEYILGTMAMRDTVDVITVIDVGLNRMMFYVPDKTGSPTRIDVGGDPVDLRRAFPGGGGRP